MEPAGSPTLAHAPPLTTLAHVAVGDTREVGGGVGGGGKQLAHSRPSWLAYDPRGGGGGVAVGET